VFTENRENKNLHSQDLPSPNQRALSLKYFVYKTIPPTFSCLQKTERKETSSLKYYIHKTKELSLSKISFTENPKRPPPQNENENLTLYSSKSPFSLLACSTILPCFLARFGLIASSFEAMVVGASFLWRWQTRREEGKL